LGALAPSALFLVAIELFLFSDWNLVCLRQRLPECPYLGNSLPALALLTRSLTRKGALNYVVQNAAVRCEGTSARERVASCASYFCASAW
jgi:hypothetical protein